MVTSLGTLLMVSLRMSSQVTSRSFECRLSKQIWYIMHPYIVLIKFSHGRLKFGYKPLSKCQFLHHYKSTMPKCLKEEKEEGMTNDWSTFSVRSMGNLQVHSLCILVCVIIWNYALQ